jgi:hypothetical protein
VSDFDETYGSSVNARMASHVGEDPRPHVDDLERRGVPGPPPVEGAQWDELHRRWEHWDERAHAWVVVGEDAGDGVAPADENPLPAEVARELLHADEMEAVHPLLPDVARAPEPGSGPPGAQWNEVEERWERWDEASGSWVVATDEPSVAGAPDPAG